MGETNIPFLPWQEEDMSEITTSKYNEHTIDQMVKRYNKERLEGRWNLWELNQTWKATRVDGVRKQNRGNQILKELKWEK